MIYFESGKMQLDLKKYLVWKNSRKTKHFNKLPVNNSIVQEVIKLFGKKYKIQYIMGKLHRYYWQSCETIEQFEQVIKYRIDNNIEEVESLIKSE